MDAVSHYLNHILTPRLRGYGVTEQFLLYTVSTIHTQMTSLLRHWNDRAFRNTVLLLGMEEGSFYEPPAKIEVRCFVVATIRNSPIEMLQSNSYAEAGLSQGLGKKKSRRLLPRQFGISANRILLNCAVRQNSVQNEICTWNLRRNTLLPGHLCSASLGCEGKQLTIPRSRSRRLIIWTGSMTALKGQRNLVNWL